MKMDKRRASAYLLDLRVQAGEIVKETWIAFGDVPGMVQRDRLRSAQPNDCQRLGQPVIGVRVNFDAAFNAADRRYFEPVRKRVYAAAGALQRRRQIIDAVALLQPQIGDIRA